MTVRSIGCAACGADVPPGRLSCPACGELLASVSGGVRSPVGDGPEPRPAPAPAAPPLPGAYLPPPPVSIPNAGGTAVMLAGPAAPARTWASASSMAAVDADSAPAGTADDDALRQKARESIGWIAVIGCAVSGLGFLVPWARTMIGSGGAGYVDQWGLAGPAHLLIVLALAAVLTLTLMVERIPAWLRLGLPGLALGSLIVGLVWPYLFGPLGTLPGAYLSLVGALMLAGAAVATLVIDRHEGPGSPV